MKKIEKIIDRNDFIEEFNEENNILKFNDCSNEEISITNEKKYYENVTDNSLNAFIKNIADYPLLTNEEERELLYLYKNGDFDSRQKLIKSNLKLVVSIAKNYYKKETSNALDLLDLVEEGIFGLIEAIDKFDLKTENRLSTFATWWIKKE